ncbi:MAG: alpha/beta fold hydrolase [Pseudomonadales bacterium]|nr:alpha/beta fold hydrolase [Pseudomonadales bacterium]
MLIEVNNCRLYVDVVGSGLVAESSRMVERPVVFVLHGGPGMDHTTMKPDFNPLADVAQLVYYDHRGQGRSDSDKSENWHLDQWADDLRGLVDTLGVRRPIVLGLSFGGFVAQNYAARHPDRLHKLILASTVARMLPGRVFDAFQQFGGSTARLAAEEFWGGPTAANTENYIRECVPYYNRTEPDKNLEKRAIWTPAVIEHFSKPGGENWTFDFRQQLADVTCPTLVTAGDIDPITPLIAVEEMAACIPEGVRRLEVFSNSGHGVHRDDPRVFEVMKNFLIE